MDYFNLVFLVPLPDLGNVANPQKLPINVLYKAKIMLVKHFILNKNCVAYDHSVQSQKKENRFSKINRALNRDNVTFDKRGYMLLLCITA